MTSRSYFPAVARAARRGAAGVLLQAVLTQGALAALSPEEAREMESLLARLNFDPGPVDGVIDERTRAAITLYQQFAALPEDGEPNAALLSELRGVAGAFTDLKAQRESQSGADAGVSATLAEAPPVADEPADADAARGAPEAKSEEGGAALDAADAAPDGAEEAAEPPPAARQAEAAPPQPAENTSKARGFSIRSVLARLLGADDEPEAAPASEAEPPAALEPEAETQTEPPADAPAEVPDPSESAAEGGPEPAADVQTAALASGGYAAFGAGHAAAREGSFERAVAAYTVALRSEDLETAHAALAHYNRADALYRLRRYDEAIADYDAAIAKDPDFADAYYNRGYAYQAGGDRKRAIADFRKARALGLQRVGARAPSAPPPQLP